MYNKIYLYGTLTPTLLTDIWFFQCGYPAAAKHLSLHVIYRPLSPSVCMNREKANSFTNANPTLSESKHSQCGKSLPRVLHCYALSAQGVSPSVTIILPTNPPPGQRQRANSH